jgi:hypothetical protein
MKNHRVIVPRREPARAFGFALHASRGRSDRPIRGREHHPRRSRSTIAGRQSMQSTATGWQLPQQPPRDQQGQDGGREARPCRSDGKAALGSVEPRASRHAGDGHEGASTSLNDSATGAAAGSPSPMNSR